MTCSITIATRNRASELRRTLTQLRRLDPQPMEVLVCADGCTDDTADMVREDFSESRLLVHEQPQGSIASRDDLIRAARGDLILSLDDDSYPIETDFIARATQLFENDAKLAVATFPQRSDEFPESLAQRDFGPARPCASYQNSGAVLRRGIYIGLGGYPRFFFHAYEEPDFALRCMAAGFEVRMHPGLTVRHHYTAAERSEMRTHFFQARNELWSVLMRCPMPWLPAVKAFRIARQLGYAANRGWRWVVREPRWWMFAALGAPRCFAHRRPVPWEHYRAWMELMRSSR